MSDRRYTRYEAERRRRPSRRRPSRRRAGRAWLVLLAAAAGVAGVAWAVGARGGEHTAAPATTVEAPVKVTFPEGLRREEIAAILEEKTHMSRAAYLEATADEAEARRRAKTPAATSLEGFLFPATFDIGSRLTEEEFVQSQLSAYDSWTGDVSYRYSRSKNLTKYEVLIIASLVEREVRVPSERPVVAGIIYNRLKHQMRLDIDATVQYALGEWKTALTVSDLAIDSPYNTRRYPGLPPGPICNPGLASIAAAARPKVTEFLYYVARDDGSGRHYFARTAEEFEAAVARARSNRGD